MTPQNQEVKVRCFCGQQVKFSRASRKQVYCDKCSQPLPMKALRQALAYQMDHRHGSELLNV